jgi:hypothetical protein
LSNAIFKMLFTKFMPFGYTTFCPLPSCSLLHGRLEQLAHGTPPLCPNLAIILSSKSQHQPIAHLIVQFLTAQYQMACHSSPFHFLLPWFSCKSPHSRNPQLQKLKDNYPTHLSAYISLKDCNNPLQLQ